MNAEVVLALISDLYAQIVALQARIRELEEEKEPARIDERRTSA